ncbi:MAG: hypothetical protein LBV09_07970 [Deferribacteraceae bacterium]|nr:hypothetical protein [Deferribacteraceae bacterium]
MRKVGQYIILLFALFHLPLSVANAAVADNSWLFYGKKGGYADNSTAMPIHHLKVSFPDCTLGNICSPNGNFSVILSDLAEQNSGKVSFFVNDTDVSMLLYYDAPKSTFRVKEFYQEQFFSHFTSDDNFFSWKIAGGRPSGDGRVRIILSNKRISGKFIDSDGDVPPLIKGKKATLHFAGSDKLVPHTFEVNIDSNGRYIAENLPTTDYKIYSKDIPLGETQIDNATEWTHTVPAFDLILSTSAPYRAGEFVVTSPESWNSRLKGTLTAFKQIAGDNVTMKINGNKIAMILPYMRKSADDLLFTGEVSGRTFLLKIPHPVPVNSGYEQFGMFNKEGYYAHTAIYNLPPDGLLSDTLPTIAINAVVPIYADTFKVHLYNTDGKAADVTSLFTWNSVAQSATISSAKFRTLYNSMAVGEGTLTGTMCDKGNSNRCFRTKHNVRKGDKTITIKAIPDSYIILRELHADKPIVRLGKTDKKGVYEFKALSTGKYQLLLADLNLESYGDEIITLSDSIEHELKVNTIRPNTDPLKITAGSLVQIYAEPIELHSTDYKEIDLAPFIPNLAEATVSLLGELPADYEVRNDGSIAILTKDNITNSYSNILFQHDDTVYQLPLFYNGAATTIVREAGLDYAMCPESRPICGNAFIDVAGVNRNIYDGKEPLQLTFPLSFKRNEINIQIEDGSDITAMFAIYPNSRRVALKKDFIPAFLSMLSNTTKPITINVKTRTYYLSLNAGYKRIETIIEVPDVASTYPLDGMRVKASCQYSGGYFSQISYIEDSRAVNFRDLPSCTYDLHLIDRYRMFQGDMSDVNISSGQSLFQIRFPISYIGGDDIQSAIALSMEDLSQELVQTLVAPDDTEGRLIISGVTPSLIVAYDNPLVFTFDTPFRYPAEDVVATLNDQDITELFVWNSDRSTLTLSNDRRNEFARLLDNRQQTIYFTIGVELMDHYEFSAVIGAGASDIVVQIVGDTPPASAHAILVGRKGVNGYEYRQSTGVVSGGRFRFASVPLGIYDIVLLGNDDTIYGSREIGVQVIASELQVELPIKRGTP